jgi:branched-chain amino acid transport system ATP-binding protein
MAPGGGYGIAGGEFLMERAPLLELIGVSRRFGGIHAVRDVSLRVEPGQIVGLIGPNGAGKTTTLNIASGFDHPTSGVVAYGGERVRALSADKVARRYRLARTFQNIRLFPRLSVLDNVRVGYFMRTRAGMTASILKWPAARREEEWTRERAEELLALVGLGGKANVSAGSLSYGEKRRVEVARALAVEPRCLLLDEPAAGFTRKETDELEALLRQLNQTLGLALLLVEHKVRFVMALAHHVVVLNFGEVLASGPPGQVQEDERVIEAYLGAPHHA